MARAFLHLTRLHDKRGKKIFGPGLVNAGYELTGGTDFQRGDVVVMWNRRPSQAHIAKLAEHRGAHLVIVENGYAGCDANGRKLYAMALNHHSGVGRTPSCEMFPNRWKQQNLTLSPWREDGRDILVLPQRGIGEAGVTMPRDWTQGVCKELKKRTRRLVRVRKHPGNSKDVKPLEEDLQNVWACVTWGSGAAVKSILYGVPVFHALKGWIGAPAAQHLSHDLEKPFCRSRIPFVRCLSWAQWSRDEIASGMAFRWLIAADNA